MQDGGNFGPVRRDTVAMSADDISEWPRGDGGESHRIISLRSPRLSCFCTNTNTLASDAGHANAK